MEKLKLTKRVDEITLNHNDWQLNADAPGVDSTAALLNKRFEELVNSGSTRHETERGMLVLMGKLPQVVGGNIEPEYVLERLLDCVYEQENE